MTIVNVDIDLGDVDTKELLEELNSRNYNIAIFSNADEIERLLNQIWQKRRLNKNFDKELDDLIYNTLGHII